MSTDELKQERTAFEEWLNKRGTPLELEQTQAFEAWQAAKAELRAAMIPALELLKEYMDSVGGCDHSVGICMCGEYSVFDDAARAVGAVGLVRHAYESGDDQDCGMGPR